MRASLVAKNLSKILDEEFEHRDKSTRALVYCWRGGERSLSLAHTLSRVGFQAGGFTLELCTSPALLSA